jgi:hypothetical protein
VKKQPFQFIDDQIQELKDNNLDQETIKQKITQLTHIKGIALKKRRKGYEKE